MSSIRTQLHDPDALLLMYLSDELPPDDRLAVAAQLAADAEMGLRLEGLRQMMGQTTSVFEALDEESSSRVVDRAVLRATAAIGQWQRQASKPSIASKKVRTAWSIPWRMPAAAAAALALAFGGYQVLQYFDSSGTEVVLRLPPPSPEERTPPDGFEDSLQMDAARTLALGTDHDGEDNVTPMPVPSDTPEVASATEQPFFDVPLTADSETAP